MNKKKENNKKRTGLGKGLGALLTSEGLQGDDFSKQILTSNSNFLEIKIEKIYPNKSQPRSTFDEEKLEELASSVKTVGIIEPIIVRKEVNGYEIIAGERRWRAAKIAELKTIPAIVKSEAEVADLSFEMMLIENIQREDLLPLEEAMGYRSILDRKNITQEKLSEIIGKSRGHITNYLRILKLPTFVKEMINNKKMSIGQAKILAGLEKEEDVKEISLAIEKNKLNVRQVEKIVATISKRNQKEASKINISLKKDPNILEVERIIREKLKTKVKVTEIKNKIGKIEIEYYSYEDLGNIIERIQSENKNI